MENVDEDMLAQVFARFGPFENIIILRDKKCAFVNLTSLRNAVNAKKTLNDVDCGGRRLKLNYAKEKIGAKPGQVRRPVRPFLGPAASAEAAVRLAAINPTPAYHPPQQQQQFFQGQAPDMEAHAPTGRGIYLGNIQEDITYHDLCTLANRFGQLESVKIVREKQCAFLNFIDPAAAHAFFMSAQSSPVRIKTHIIKINWAKSGILGGEVIAAVRQGGTRNLFVGNVEDHITDEVLREVFKNYGEFDTVVVLKDKKIAFVNLLQSNLHLLRRTA